MPSGSIKCFVVGCPRSGTTLLSVLLDRHGAIAMTPETDFFTEIAPEAVVPPEEVRRRLASWRRLSELGLSWDIVAAASGESERPEDLFATVLTLHASARGRPFAGEKTPQHWRHVRRLLEGFPEATVLWMMRDGRDVVGSLTRMPWWRWGDEAAARLWAEAAESAAELTEAFPDRVLQIRHEALVAAPERTLSEVMQALGLAFRTRQLDDTAPSAVVLDRSLAWKAAALDRIDPARGAIARPPLPAHIAAILRPGLARFGYLDSASGSSGGLPSAAQRSNAAP